MTRASAQTCSAQLANHLAVPGERDPGGTYRHQEEPMYPVGTLLASRGAVLPARVSLPTRFMRYGKSDT
jgi:hypothetical protein